MHHNQVAKWRRRYIRGGLGALQDEPRSGREGSIGTEVLRQIVDQATRPPQGGRAGLAARDGQRAGRLQGHRAAGLESQQNQTAFDACL
jgi:hypothetical protein